MSNLYGAVYFEDWDRVYSIIENDNGQGWTDFINFYGNNIFHLACSRNIPSDIVQCLLSASSNHMLLMHNQYGYTPLHKALSGCSDEIILMILNACPQAATIVSWGKTPLCYSILQNRSQNVIKNIIKANNSNLNFTRDDRNEALWLFFRNWNIDLCSVMMWSHKNKMKDLLDIIDVIPESEIKEYGGTKKLRDIYELTLLLIYEYSYGNIDKADTTMNPFKAFTACLNNALCPWSFCKMILRVNPEIVYEQDESGECLLHKAAASVSSLLDGNLYKCVECDSKIEQSWYQHRDDFSLRYCLKCVSLWAYDEIDHIKKTEFVLMKSIDKIPTITRDLIAANPQAASLPNNNGKLPFHLAVQRGKMFEEGATYSLLKASPMALSSREIASHLYPFMIAAVEEIADDEKNKMDNPHTTRLQNFSLCFDLLMENPCLIEVGCCSQNEETPTFSPFDISEYAIETPSESLISTASYIRDIFLKWIDIRAPMKVFMKSLIKPLQMVKLY